MTAGGGPRIGMVGAFDVANLGDTLFPLVAARELRARLEDPSLTLYGTSDLEGGGWPYPVRAVARLAEEIDDLDLLLVGGGDLIRFDAHPIHGGSGWIDFPELWLAPTILAADRGVPVAWNAVGIPWALDRAQGAKLADAVERLSYLAVRDARSAQITEQVHDHAGATVVPDTVFGIWPLGPAREPEPGTYVLVQASPALRRWRFHLWAIVRVARRRGLAVVEVPISPALGDRAGAVPLTGAVIRPRPWPDPLELCRIIAGARAVAGLSLHLSMVAAVHGVPAFRPRAPAVTKHAVLDDFEEVHVMRPALPPRVHPSTCRTGPPPARLEGLRVRLNAHWARISKLPRKASARRQGVQAHP